MKIGVSVSPPSRLNAIWYTESNTKLEILRFQELVMRDAIFNAMDMEWDVVSKIHLQ